MDPKQALEKLHALHHGFHSRLCMKYIRSREAVEDCVQEGYRRFLEIDRDFSDLEEAEKYLCRIMTNHFIDHLRHRQCGPRQVDVADLSKLPVGLQPGMKTDPESQLLDQARDELRGAALDAMSRSLEKLPPSQREVIHLMFFRDPPMTVREIGVRKKLAPSSVYARVKKAIQSLSKCAKAYRGRLS